MLKTIAVGYQADKGGYGSLYVSDSIEKLIIRQASKQGMSADSYKRKVLGWT